VHYGHGSSLRSTFDSDQQQQDPIAHVVFSKYDPSERLYGRQISYAGNEKSISRHDVFNAYRGPLIDSSLRFCCWNTKYQDETSYNKSVCRLTRVALTRPADSRAYKVPGRPK
ncbi:hypothetical protein ALC60_03518, partial [Trachymyrmex zeteki]